MPAAAAEIAVPFPLSTPVTVVLRVIAGVVVAVATVPASPLADTTDVEVTVPDEPVADRVSVPPRATVPPPEIPDPLAIVIELFARLAFDTGKSACKVVTAAFRSRMYCATALSSM